MTAATKTNKHKMKTEEGNIAERTLGVSWRTSVSGYAETLCVIVILITALPSDVWASPKVWVPITLGLIAKTIKDSITKDVKVTGGIVKTNVSVEKTVAA